MNRKISQLLIKRHYEWNQYMMSVRYAKHTGYSLTDIGAWRRFKGLQVDLELAIAKYEFEDKKQAQVKA